MVSAGDHWGNSLSNAAFLSSSIFVVDQRKFAVVFSFGQIVRVIEKPGLQIKYPSPFESVRFFDRRILTIDNPEAERFITAEKKNLLVDSYVKWRIVDPRKFFISFKFKTVCIMHPNSCFSYVISMKVFDFNIIDVLIKRIFYKG